MPNLTLDEFAALVRSVDRSDGRTVMVPLAERYLADQLTPVLAYRRLVAPDERTAPSFLLESVEGGERQGRYSILGARPAREVVAYGHDVKVVDNRPRGVVGGMSESWRADDPLTLLKGTAGMFRFVRPPERSRDTRLPASFLGGWVGYASYDTVRYAEPGKLGFDGAPPDDRGLPDLHFGFYDGVVVFDHVDKLVHVVELASVGAGAEPAEAYLHATGRIEARAAEISRHSKPLPLGRVEREPARPPLPSNTTREGHAAMVARAKEYIRAGDVFQVVLGQRFERRSGADPFDVYRALRAVNPSPYMAYLQAEGCILVASSPEILCRVRHGAPHGGGPPRAVLTNRPLAGTRRRGATHEEDAALERELLADAKERAEHIMLVDLGRNDVGRVCRPGTVELPRVMEVERYSHVMHISSTVTGELREGLDCWDALRATLPVGTISGAPKIRAMQIIDELEPVRRGPYGGGFGFVGLDGDMDIALALRTIVVPTGEAWRAAGAGGRARWTYHIQAAGGIVADSEPGAEHQETVNKAAAMARAVDLAEAAFGGERSARSGADRG